jgi:hypothetical protein
LYRRIPGTLARTTDPTVRQGKGYGEDEGEREDALPE